MKLSKILIDAKLLLEDLGQEPYIWTETDSEIQEHSDWLRFKDMIECQPTVDAVEVVHGRWEEYQVPHIMCCSECDWATGVQDDFNYCPNCGAKMDGDGNVANE